MENLRLIFSRLISLTLNLVVFLLGASAQALPVFPGAEGFGAGTVAGRGGTIYRVTNLNDSGTGSLRAAITASGPRIVVFEISGTIALKSTLTIKNPYITIAGQTAPSPGITLRNAPLYVDTHDVLIQHIRVRTGDENVAVDGSEADGIAVLGDNVVIDHCSISWATDENLSTWYSPKNLTFSNNLIAEALYHSFHPNGPHSMGFLIGDYTTNVTVIRNFLAHNNQRNILVQDGSGVYANNLVYNAGEIWFQFEDVNDDTGASNGTINSIVNNLFVRGADTEGREIFWYTGSSSKSKIYLSGNVANGSILTRSGPWVSSPPVSLSGLTIIPTDQVTGQIPNTAGARPADRDAVDIRIVNDYRNGRGRIIDSPSEVGGYPTLAVNTRAFNAPSNPNGDDDGDGYTNVEEVLFTMAAAVEGKSTVPSTPTPTPSPVPTATPTPIPTATPAASGQFSSVDSYLGNSANWDFLITSRWQVASDQSNLRLGIVTSDYTNLPTNRLGEMALLKNRTYTDFSFSTLMRSNENFTANTSGDCDIVFGHRDPMNYFYFMLSSAAGNSQLFEVRNGTRYLIATAGVANPSSTSYHAVVLTVQDGTAVVSLNGKQILSSALPTGISHTGRLGLGSYNDSCLFDDPKVTAPVTTLPTEGQFSSADTYLGNIASWDLLNPNRWKLVNDQNSLRLGIITSDYTNLPTMRLGEMALLKNRTYSNFSFSMLMRSNENFTANTSGDCNIVFGHKDSMNYFYFMLSSAAHNSQLFEVRGGTRYLIGTAGVANPSSSSYQSLTLQVSGSSTVVRLNGQQILSVTLPAGISTTGRLGVGSYNDSCYFDDPKVSVP